jgi:hypothetical protein
MGESAPQIRPGRHPILYFPMNALWQIMLRILWRLRPVTALEVNLRDVVEIGFAMFAHDHAFADVCADPERLAPAVGDAPAKLDLLT